jgi:molecular chaperone GrpE
VSAEKCNSAETPEEQGETKEAPEEDQASAKRREMEELTETVKRIQADFDNFRKRTDREWQQRTKLANRNLMIDLLPVLDSLDKALEDSGKNSSADSMRTGMEGVRRQLLQVLQREGLKEIRSSGKFDPFLHEALMREESEDADDGRILEVYQKGYAIGSDPIRTAKVKVAKRKEPPSESTTAQDEQDDEESEETEQEGDE